MKNITKILLFTAMFGLASVGYSQFRAGAGFTLPISGGSAYPGINIKGTYSFTEQIEASAAFSPVFVDYGSWFIIDFDGQYVFYSTEKFGIFGLAGLALNMQSVEVWGMRVSSTTAGFNIGAGANINLTETLVLVPDLRYTIVQGGGIFRGTVVLQYRF